MLRRFSRMNTDSRWGTVCGVDIGDNSVFIVNETSAKSVCGRLDAQTDHPESRFDLGASSRSCDSTLDANSETSSEFPRRASMQPPRACNNCVSSSEPTRVLLNCCNV